MRYISVYAGDILQGSDFAFPISSNVPTIPEPTKWVARRAKARMRRSGNRLLPEVRYERNEVPLTPRSRSVF